jgi:hypothetical protein
VTSSLQCAARRKDSILAASVFLALGPVAGPSLPWASSDPRIFELRDEAPPGASFRGWWPGDVASSVSPTRPPGVFAGVPPSGYRRPSASEGTEITSCSLFTHSELIAGNSVSVHKTAYQVARSSGSMGRNLPAAAIFDSVSLIGIP